MEMASDSKDVVPVTLFMERNVLHVHPWYCLNVKSAQSHGFEYLVPS